MKPSRSGRFQEKVSWAEDGSKESVPLADTSITQVLDKDGRVVSRAPDYQEISKAELAQRAAEVIAQAQTHYLVWEGPWAVCTSCPFRHSVPLDFTKYDLVDGNPVRKPIAK